MSQLSYSVNMTIGIEGALVDTNRGKDTVSKVSSADLPCARLLVRDAAIGDRGAKLPDADFGPSTGVVLGVLMWESAKVADGAAGENYSAGDSLPVLRSGRIWVRAEDIVTQGNNAFARYAAGAGGTELGRFRSDLDTAAAAAVPTARFFTSTTGADELVQLEINLPATTEA